MVENKQSLTRLRLAVQYPDNFIKCQNWKDHFINVTDRLVFKATQMNPPERRQFIELHQDWRLNPCLVRYRCDGEEPDFFCQRGTDGRKGLNSAARGHPLAIEFHFQDNHAVPKVYHCNTTWMNDTAALIFEHAPDGDPAGLVIRRVTPDSTPSVVDIPHIATPGPMPRRGSIGNFPCGYGGFTRVTWG
jgi:hypothetical protein